MESRGRERRRRDLNPRGAMHPYLLSREAHSTGLCDVSSADYSRPFSPRARTAPAARAQQAVGSAEGEGFEPPVPLLTQRFSRPSLSATQTALQTCLILQERATQCRQRGHRRREPHDDKRVWPKRATLLRDRAHAHAKARHPPPAGDTPDAHARAGPEGLVAHPHRSHARGGPGHAPRARLFAATTVPSQPRRPKKFQDFLSGAGSSG